MVGSLSERAQRVMGAARDESLRLNHEYLGTEHILLGITGVGAGVSADCLASLGVTLERVRSCVQRRIGVGPAKASPDDRGVTPRAGHVMEFAREEAALRGSGLVEPEHLLLGVTRELQGVAAQVLRDLQTPPESVAAKVSAMLAE